MYSIGRPYSNINYFPLGLSLARALSEFKSSNIFIKAEDSFSKTPSALIDRLMYFTDWYFFSCSMIKSVYFEYLPCILFLG